MAQYLDKDDLDALWAKLKLDFTHSLAIAGASIKLTRVTHTGDDLSTETVVNCGEITQSDLQSFLSLGAMAYKSSLTASDIPTLQISKISGLQTALNNKLETSLKGAAGGLAELDANAKLLLSQVPDVLLGQVLYGGTVNAQGVATLTTNVKTKLGIATDTVTLVNEAGTSTTYGWVRFEGVFFIMEADSSFASLGLKVGDWLLSTGTAWKKVDNTDAVTGVKGNAETNYRIGNINITPANIGLGNVENTALSTWTGSSNITKIGTLTEGTVPWARLSGVPTASSSTLGLVKVGTTLTISNSVLNLPTTGVSAGIYKSVKVDAYGRVTEGSNPTTLAEYGITDAKSKQTAKSDPSASGNAISFIDTISQNENGEITATKKTVRSASGTQSGIVTTDSQTFGGDKTFNGNVQSMKGIAARGIANLNIGAGSGTGDVTSIKFGNGSLISSDDGLLAVPVGQGSVNGSVSIGGQDVPVKGLGTFAYLSSLAFADLTDKPSTLEGYGITDAKITNGVITLGSNTITPLTAHQAIYGLTIKNSAGTAVLSYNPKTAAGDLTLTKAMVGLGNVANQTITVTDTSVSDGTHTFTNAVESVVGETGAVTAAQILAALSVATQSAKGLMSATDKKYLDWGSVNVTEVNNVVTSFSISGPGTSNGGSTIAQRTITVGRIGTAYINALS